MTTQPAAALPQTTYVRVAKSNAKDARYVVSGIKIHDNGTMTLVRRQPSGKAVYLTRKDVGTARFYAAISHFQAQHPAR